MGEHKILHFLQINQHLKVNTPPPSFMNRLNDFHRKNYMRL